MIEPVEQSLLTDLATYMRFERSDVVCEFGAFFGRSTRCIADGLVANRSVDWQGRGVPTLRVYDSFSCQADGPLAAFVRASARQGGVEHLIDRQGDRASFARIFDHYMSGTPPELFARSTGSLATARHTGEPIALMHVDAPKWYAELRQLLREFGPSLRVGAHVVFQDFFYHWSAELITAIHLLVESGFLAAKESAASSLLTQVERPLSARTIDDLHEAFVSTDVDAALARVVTYYTALDGLDRPEYFTQRVALAAAQHAFESKQFARAAKWVSGIVRRFPNGLPVDLGTDLCDLLAHGFSLRGGYLGDIGIESD
jgi:hypothetical protein